MFSEYWLTLHNRLDRADSQKPFEIPYAREHSVFWRATEERSGNIAAFFRKLQPFHLADAPGGDAYITTDAAVMTRGNRSSPKVAHACHSSKQPPARRRSAIGRGESVVRAPRSLKPDFLENNFLSNEKRIRSREIKTNSARALGTNAKRGHIWDNFSSRRLQGVAPAERSWNFSILSMKRSRSNSTGGQEHRSWLLSRALTR